MSVQQLIEHIKALSQEDYAEVVNFLNREDDYQLAEAISRDEELESGTVVPLSHAEVIAKARQALR